MANATITTKTRENIRLIPGLMEKVAKHEKQLEHTHHVLFGNGEPGWDEKLREIITWIHEQKERTINEGKEQRATEIYYKRLVIGTALYAVVMLLINGFVWFFKILPVLATLEK